MALSFSFTNRKKDQRVLPQSSVNTAGVNQSANSYQATTQTNLFPKSTPQVKLSQSNVKALNTAGGASPNKPVQSTRPVTTTPPPSNDQVTPPLTNNWGNPYLESLRESAERRAGNKLGRAEEQANSLRESYERQAGRTRSLIPKYQETFGNYQKSMEQQMAEDQAYGEQQKEAAREEYGLALRQGAEANRSTQNQIQGIFAGLGTLDGSSFGQQILNQGNQFTGNQQSLLKQQARDITQIDRDVAAARREAQNLIQAKALELEEKIANIENTLDQGSQEYEAAIRNAYGEAYDYIDQIDGELAQFEYQAYEKASKGSGKPVGEAQLSQIADFDNSTQLVGGLTSVINQYKSMMGPVQGRIASANPYNTDAQIFNSQMKAAAQMVGRAMEGGVLRQEDVPKYEAILPKITDTPEVALGKIQNVTNMLINQRNNRSGAYQQAGYSGTGYVQPGLQANDITSLGAQF